MGLAELTQQIAQGQLFRSDQVSKNGAPARQLGELAELAALFDHFNAAGLEGQTLRAAPTMTGAADPLAVCAAFARLWRERRSGRLFVRNSAGAEWAIAFREGRPINATSNVEHELIGRLLIAHGLIDEATFQRAVENRRVEGGRIGEALVRLGALQLRDLNRILAIQAMDRLVTVFKQPEGRLSFVPDERAQDDVRLLVSVRDIIETGLAAALSGEAIGQALRTLGDPVLKAQVSPALAEGLSPGDEQVLRLLSGGQRLSAALPQVAQVAALTPAEAQVRVLALVQYGVLGVLDETYRELSETLARLQGLNYFRLLDVRRADDAQAIEAAYALRQQEYGAIEQAQDTPFVRTLRGQIQEILDRARGTLLDEDERQIYERAVQLGLDASDPTVRQTLEYEVYAGRGRAMLDQQKYEDSVRYLERAQQLRPQDAKIHLLLAWARFLSSERNPAAAAEAVRQVRRAIEIGGETDEAQLYIGKMYRLSGETSLSEEHLRKAIALNPNNNEAHSELRLLFVRELDRGKRKRSKGSEGRGGGGDFDLSGLLSGGLAGKLSVWALLLFALLYAGANLAPGGLMVWPDARVEGLLKSVNERGAVSAEVLRMQVWPQINLNYEEPQMITAARQMGGPETIKTKAEAFAYLSQQDIRGALAALQQSNLVPPDQQRLGNQEYFYAASDVWWWARRGAPILFALVGLALFMRKGAGPLSIAGERPGIGLLGLPYGVLIGFLAYPVQLLESSTGLVLGMTLVHVLAESLFFFVLLGRGLLQDFKAQPAVAIVVFTVLWAVYHLSFFHIMNLSVAAMVPALLTLGASGGAAYIALMWPSRGGILWPILAHLTMWVTLMLRSLMGGGL